MKKIKVGLIGYGYWGPNIARILNDSDKVDLLYCADILNNSLKQIKKNYPKIKTTKDYKVILEDKQIEAVFVVTPTKTHFTIARDCLLTNKHVFVEKPLTDDENEAIKLINLAKKNKKLLAVGHIFLLRL